MSDASQGLESLGQLTGNAGVTTSGTHEAIVRER